MKQYRYATDPNHTTGHFDTDCARCHGQISWKPARFDHNRFYPLEFTHKLQPCGACHPGGVYGGTSSACYACHAGAYNGPTHPDHKALHFSTDCGPCHAPTTWKQVRKNWHDVFFPTAIGKHAGFACSDCHIGTEPLSSFVCTTCHTAAKTNGKHDDVGGYVWASQACYSCHPTGKGD